MGFEIGNVVFCCEKHFPKEYKEFSRRKTMFKDKLGWFLFTSFYYAYRKEKQGME